MHRSKLNDALIGYTGFVGSTLLRQRRFDHLYNSKNSDEMCGKEFNTVVCAGAPAQKWLANKEPEADLARIDALIQNLTQVRCKKIILISTVDVFSKPVGMLEYDFPDEQDLGPYGKHRLLLEKTVFAMFENVLVVRLPALVGPGLKKNVIFDLHNGNLSGIDGRASFQFYPMVNLNTDIERANSMDLNLMHLTAEPLIVSDIALEAFGIDLPSTLTGVPAKYDFISTHAWRFGTMTRVLKDYQYSARESLLAIRAYAQSEPKTR